jgi:hypothetical protein
MDKKHRAPAVNPMTFVEVFYQALGGACGSRHSRRFAKGKTPKDLK